ncbi:MAG TPA: N-6 DNA methylase [Ktedonobacterales bacterium]|nr:N-6 DNA methylase [Ktedonobacterales bacterium]
MKQLKLLLDAALPSPSEGQIPPIPSAGMNAASGATVPGAATRRLLGAFYSPQSAADFMAEWSLRYDGERILEPSFGDGVFLRAIARSAAHKDFPATRLLGIEIDEQARSRAAHKELLTDGELLHADFLDVEPSKVQAVIGNPPYVRLRRLPEEQRQRALRVACQVLGQSFDPAGSLWGPFLLHALRFLDIGGRLAFVLPYEFTYVRYGRPLWNHLRNCFGSIRVLRTHERLFPELLQDVIILLADDFGAHTNVVRYQAFERVEELLQDRPLVDERLVIEDVIQGERAFLGALLGDELRTLLDGRLAKITTPARKSVTFNIGYVTGDKSFFHPTKSVVSEYYLPAQSLLPSLITTRDMRSAGLRTSAMDRSRVGQLFLPDSPRLTEGEKRYIAMGEAQGVSSRYKCRVRHPWYIVPGVRTPDVMLSVFSERPILLINDAGYVASNSLLCGYLTKATSEELAVRWYTSLTLLQCELEVHALGGGVMIMVPHEAGNIRLPDHVRAQEDHLSRLDHLLRGGKIKDAYYLGDREILMNQLGLHEHDVELIHHGIEVLTHWRTSARSSRALRR